MGGHHHSVGYLLQSINQCFIYDCSHRGGIRTKKEAYIIVTCLTSVLMSVLPVCVGGGGSSFCLLVTYLISILCVCGGGGVILLAGYLPDGHSVCGGGSSFCLLVTYLMSILCGGGCHSACWLPT